MERNFGRYRTRDEEEIGRGGFGRVYRALDTNVNRLVALKVLALEGTEEELSRFEAEAYTTSQLQHKNIVTVHDFGKHESMPYIVMELLEGETLLEKIDSKLPLTLLQKMEIMQQVAEGLQYAHFRKVIHRDIKPANIMVNHDGNVKIMDFGIARVTRENVTRRTLAGTFLGTPSYTAPERFKSGESDIKTDIFSFGVVYYQLLTGINPFSAPDWPQVMYRVQHVDPPAISEVVREIPGALEYLVGRLLEKDRDERYDSFEAILRDSRPILSRLQQERAYSLFEQIRPQLEAGQLEELNSLLTNLREILALHEHGDARLWHDRLEQQARRQVQLGKVERFKREAEEYSRGGRFQEAIAALENAARLTKDDDLDLFSLLEGAKAAFERQSQSKRLYKEARQLETQDALAEALEKLNQALEWDPGHRQAELLREQLRIRVDEARTAAILQQAQSFLAAKKYGQALDVLRKIGAADSNAAKAVALRVAIENERKKEEEREKKRRLQQQIAEAREDLRRGSLTEAKAKAERLSDEFQNQTAIAEIMETIAAKRREQTVAQALRSAKGLLGEQRFAAATAVLEDALATCPGDSALKQLLESVNSQERAANLVEAIRKVLRASDELTRVGRNEEALARIEAGIGEIGQQAQLVEQARRLRLEIETRKKEEEKRRIIEGALQGADEFETNGNFRSALELLENARKREPDARLNKAAERVAQKLRRQERADRLVAEEEQVTALIRANDWDQAIRSISSAQHEFPEHANWTAFETQARDGRHQRDFQTLQEKVESALEQDQLRDANDLLSASASEFGNEPVWRELTAELDGRRQCWDRLERAEEALRSGKLRDVKALVSPLLNGVYDGQAKSLLERAKSGLQKAEELERERQLREAESRKRDRERGIAKALLDVTSLAKKKDFPEAFGLLERTERDYPGSVEVRQAWEQVRNREEEFQRTEEERTFGEQREREIQEQAKQEREEEIAHWLAQADGLETRGDLDGALALLKPVVERYGDDRRLRQRYQAILGKLQAAQHSAREAEERARIEAEEREARIRIEEIRKGRAKASELLATGGSQEAIGLLERLNAKYPDQKEIVRDLRAASKKPRKIRTREGLMGGAALALILAIVMVLKNGGEHHAEVTPKADDARTTQPKPQPQHLDDPVATPPETPGPKKPEGIVVSPERLSFESDGTSKPEPQSLEVTGDTNFTVSSVPTWLRVSRNERTGHRAVVSVAVAGLSAGPHAGHVQISGPDGDKTVPVELRINRMTTIHWSGTIPAGESATIGGETSSSGGRTDLPLPSGIISANVTGITALGTANVTRSVYPNSITVTNHGDRAVERLTIVVVSK